MNPELARSPRAAKIAAAALATAIGAELLQMPGGQKRILHNGKSIDCGTWLECWSYCYRIRKDQVEAEQKRDRVPVAQHWTGPVPPNAPKVGY